MDDALNLAEANSLPAALGSNHADPVRVISDFPEGVSYSLQTTMMEWSAVLPAILTALFVLALGLLFGYSVEWLLMMLGKKLRLSVLWRKIEFEQFLHKAGVKTHPTHLVGKLVKGIIITYFLRMAAGILGFTEVERFLGTVIEFVPKVVIAMLILLFAIKAANTAASLVTNLMRIGDDHARIIMAAVAKNILIAFGVMAALVEIQIAEELVQILFTAFAAMLALAGGLAFGLGGKEVVYDILSDLKNRARQRKAGHEQKPV